MKCRGQFILACLTTGKAGNCPYLWMDVKYDPVSSNSSHHRRTIRLQEYDYSSPGAYFVTIVTYQREALFGEIVDGEMYLNASGQIVREEWFRTAAIRSFVRLEQDEFVIMPNHIHGILWFEENFVGATCQVAPTSHRKNGPQVGSLGYVIGQFKSITTRRINAMSESPGVPLWQRNYFEHIIRNDRELNEIRKYIQANPILWENDKENPQALSRSD